MCAEGTYEDGAEVPYEVMAQLIGDALVRAIAGSERLGHSSVAITLRDYLHGPRLTPVEVVVRALTGCRPADMVAEWPWIREVGVTAFAAAMDRAAMDRHSVT
jgi:hypothetical protein